MGSSINTYLSQLKIIIRDHTAKRNTNFIGQLNTIEDKIRTTSLHLAVVGEFSSGKSTFINAILRNRLLKEAVMPTTASATYITKAKPTNPLFKLFGHTKTNIKVSFSSNQSFSAHEGDFADIQQYIYQNYSERYDNIYDIITCLTSEQKVAKDILKLNIYLKNDFLPEDIILIDTPGFNPGERSIDNHLEITQDVVENRADLAIVLIPAAQAMSRTLTNFLEAHVKRYLHRCIFVITKMDNLDPVSRKSVEIYVKDNLKSIGVENPQAHALSAWTMLPVKSIPPQLKDEWSYWQNQFESFEKQIWKKLAKNKNIVIQEHIYHLLEKLAETLHSELSLATEMLNEALRKLKENTVHRIEELTSNILSREQQRLDNHYASVNVSSASFVVASVNECNRIISRGGKLSNFDKNEKPQIEQCIKSQTQRYIDIVSNGIANSNLVMDTVIANFRKEFDSHYKDMPSLNPNYAQSSMNGIKGKDASVTSNVNSAISGEQSLHFGKSLGTAALGAGIGTLILPGIGTAIGAAIGGLLGFFGLGPSEEKIQRKAKDAASEAIKKHFEKVEQRLKAEFDRNRQTQKLYLGEYCKKHIKEYSKRVKKLIKEQSDEKVRLQNMLGKTQSAIQEVNALKSKFKIDTLNLKQL